MRLIQRTHLVYYLKDKAHAFFVIRGTELFRYGVACANYDNIVAMDISVVIISYNEEKRIEPVEAYRSGEDKSNPC